MPVKRDEFEKEKELEQLTHDIMVDIVLTVLKVPGAADGILQIIPDEWQWSPSVDGSSPSRIDFANQWVWERRAILNKERELKELLRTELMKKEVNKHDK